MYPAYPAPSDRALALEAELRSFLDAEVLPFEKESNVLVIRGDIDAEHSSLIAAMGETGENIQLAMALADIFGGQIDFNSDLQQGDRFELLFEKSTREGQFAGYGNILAATFVADGKAHQAIRWVNPETGKRGDLFARVMLVLPDGGDPKLDAFCEQWRRERPYTPARRR